MKLNDLFEGNREEIDKEFNRLKNDNEFVNNVIADLLRDDDLANTTANREQLKKYQQGKYLDNAIRKYAARRVRDKREL